MKVRTLMLAGVALVAPQSVYAQPTSASDQTAPEKGKVAEQTGEEKPTDIVVTGIRGSLQRGADAKRTADVIKDVIDAEDIGKLPDTNVAEALARVTGVQIDRELGEGSEVSVRGFSENRVEVNGATQVGTSGGGATAFQTIPSEAFKSLEVIKTPAADHVEGALGAIIRLNTRKPLDSKKDIFALSGDAQYADRAGKWAPNASATLSKRWDGDWGEFGILLTGTYKGRKLRQDFFEVRGWEAVNGFGRDFDGDGVIGEPVERDSMRIITNLQDGVYVPLNTLLRIREQRRDLYSLTSAFQFRPSDRLELYFDGTYTRNEANDRQFQYTAAFEGALENDPGRGGNRIRAVYQNPTQIPVTENQTVISALLGQVSATGVPQRGVNFTVAGNSNPIKQDAYSFTTGAKYDINDRFKVHAEMALGVGKQVNDQTFTNSALANFNDNPFYYYEFSEDSDIPTLIPLQRRTSGVGTTAVTADNRVNLLDLVGYRLNGGTHQIQSSRDFDRAFKVDFHYDLDWGPLSGLKFGARIAHRNGRRSRLRAEDSTTTLADGTLSGTTFGDLDRLYPGLIIQQPYDDVLNGATGDFPRDWIALDSAYVSANISDLRRSANIVPVPDPGWGFEVSQETQAAYARLDYEFDFFGIPTSGNAGVRYVRTQQTAIGSFTVRQASPTPLTFTQKYHDWLPSLNFRGTIGDRFYVRIGAAQAIARPQASAVAPLIDVNFNNNTGNGGNPNLRPQRTVQADLSVEKYYGKANLISAAFFYKDYSERIEDGIVTGCFALPAGTADPTDNDGCDAGEEFIRVNSRVNSGAAKIKGFEVSWQQSMDFLPSPLDGFGVIANYTYVDANGGSSLSDSGRRLPFQDLSKHSYNLVGYFEKWGFAARAAYSWRSSFFDDRSDTSEASMARPYGQLDASLSYEVNKKISISLEGINLLNAPERRYQELRERPLAYRVNDTRFLFGIRIRN